MTQNQVSHLIAACTGESLSVIRRLGFQIEPQSRGELATEELCLVVHCPFCHGAVPYPGRSRDGSNPMAECERCDVYFPFRDQDVFPASASRLTKPTPARHRYLPA
jgi:hypothetical protein